MAGLIDPETRKPRLLSAQCATCVGRPGNLMDLRAGRLKRLVQENAQGGLICHETLPYGQHPETGEAFCRWYYDTYGHLVNYFRISERLGGFTEVDVPS